MTKVLMVIAKDQFRDEELFETKAPLENAGFEVLVASSTKEECKGKMGGNYMPDLALEDVNPDEFDAIVFVGGPGASEYFEDSLAHKLAQHIYERGKIVSAICIAPVILAHAGLLLGKKVTSFPTGAPELFKKGALYTEDMDVVRDGQIVTANGPQSSTKFGNKLVEILTDK